MRYWYHPESDSVWADKADPRTCDSFDAGLIEEITEAQFLERGGEKPKDGSRETGHVE